MRRWLGSWWGYLTVRGAILVLLAASIVVYYLHGIVTNPDRPATDVVIERMLAMLPYGALLIPLDFVIAWWGWQAWRRFQRERGERVQD